MTAASAIPLPVAVKSILLFEVPLQGKIYLGTKSFEIAGRTVSVEIAPGDEIIIECQFGKQIIGRAPARLSAEMNVPLPEEWMTIIEHAERRASIRPIHHELRGQLNKFGTMALIGVLIFLLVQAFKTLAPETFMPAQQKSIDLGGWMAFFVVLVIQGAAFMDALKRGQPNDWFIQIASLVIDYLFVIPFFVKGITVNVSWLNEQALALIGLLMSLVLLYLFAILQGRDLTTPAAFWMTKALIALSSQTWGSIGVMIHIPTTDLWVVLVMIFAFCHQLFDVIWPVVGRVRSTTVIITAIGIGVYFLAIKIAPGPWWNMWLIAVAVTMGAAAIGSDYQSKHVEERPGALGVVVTVADRLLRENQYDAVIAVNIILVIGHIAGWF